MDVLLPYLVTAGCPAVVLGLFTRPARRIRRRGTAGAGLVAAPASYEEAFRTTSHAAYHEIQAQARRRAPADSPDGRRRRRPRGRG
ncbi:hypothetical protein [Streptomyces sp. NPDC059378]|uniref:hypothetical protein n=1 Tax=Streptomyces sp. NPDC059378 TaxID=3346815 RepID=UPI00367EDE77